jgi:hypothetical protein
MEKSLPILGLGIILIVVASGCTQQPACNPPYIIKGGQCCLDQNNNGICDVDETGGGNSTVTPVAKNYSSFEVKMYIQDVESESTFWRKLPPSPPKNYEGYQIFSYNANQSYYDGGWLYLYTRYLEEPVICLLKEYHDSVIFNQQVVRLDKRPEVQTLSGASVQALFLKADKPRFVRYDIDCRGDESGITFKDAYQVGLVAP